MNHATLTRLFTPMLSAAALIVTPVMGGTDTASSGKEPIGKNVITEAPKEESVFDKIWGFTKLYKNDSNPIIEELSLTGRYHGQFWAADGEKENDQDWENRRFRLGLESTWFDKHLKLKGEIFSNLDNLSEEDDSFYDGFTELWARIQANDTFNLTVGKQKPKFGWEWSTSSRMILTFERGQLINQFKPDYTAGATIDGKIGKWSYYAGAFADDTTKEMADFNGGSSYIASIGYDLKDTFGFDKAQWRLDYIHSERDAADEVLTAFDNGVSTSLDLKNGQWGLGTEAIYGEGSSNAWSLLIEPSYDITKKLQVVGRYQFSASDDSNGLTSQKRYEREVGAGTGDLYNAGYLGLNYYIYEHKLKLMTGVEYANMSGGKNGSQDTWTYFAGVRVYW